MANQARIIGLMMCVVLLIMEWAALLNKSRSTGRSHAYSMTSTPVTGTVRRNNVGVLNAFEWYRSDPDIGAKFNDGDEVANGGTNECGYVYASGDSWKAAAYPDHDHGVRYYHSVEAAIAYVSDWCRP